MQRNFVVQLHFLREKNYFKMNETSQTDHTNSNSLDSFLFRILILSLSFGSFLHLVDVIIEDVSELSPGLLRDGNGSPVSREDI